MTFLFPRDEDLLELSVCGSNLVQWQVAGEDLHMDKRDDDLSLILYIQVEFTFKQSLYLCKKV